MASISDSVAVATKAVRTCGAMRRKHPRSVGEIVEDAARARRVTAIGDLEEARSSVRAIGGGRAKRSAASRFSNRAAPSRAVDAELLRGEDANASCARAGAYRRRGSAASLGSAERRFELSVASSRADLSRSVAPSSVELLPVDIVGGASVPDPRRASPRRRTRSGARAFSRRRGSCRASREIARGEPLLRSLGGVAPIEPGSRFADERRTARFTRSGMTLEQHLQMRSRSSISRASSS
jgi:hypothetical protein